MEEQSGQTQAGVSEGTSSEVTPAAASGPAEGSIPPVAGEGATNATPPALPTFTPNWKFKVHDQEHEIPEQFRGIVKDADTEKKVREIFEKAYGLDFVKPKFEKTRQTLETIQTEHSQLKNSVNQLGMYLKHKDFDSFFDGLGVAPENVYQWVHQKLMLREMEPEQRAVYEERQRLLRDNYQLSQQNQLLSQSHSSVAEQARLQELNTTMARPEVKTVAEAFDAKLGKPGAFQQELIMRAATREHMLRSQGAKAEVTAAEIMNEMLALYGHLGQQPQMSQQPAPPQAAPGTQTKPPPVIPNVGGKNASPTKRIPKSIAELRKLADEFPG
jgi:hypothetical protein